MKILFKQWACELITSTYTADDSKAMLLVDMVTNEPICYVTVCLVDLGIKPDDGNVIIKDYDNPGMVECMIEHGVILDNPVKMHKHGFVESHEYHLTEKGLSLWED